MTWWFWLVSQVVFWLAFAVNVGSAIRLDRKRRELDDNLTRLRDSMRDYNAAYRRCLEFMHRWGIDPDDETDAEPVVKH